MHTLPETSRANRAHTLARRFAEDGGTDETELLDALTAELGDSELLQRVALRTFRLRRAALDVVAHDAQHRAAQAAPAGVRLNPAR